MKLQPSWKVIVGLAALLALQGAQAADPLPTKFKVEKDETSVSGLSSGAYMAVQLQVAYSASIKGSGVVAGGPYYCAANSLAFAAICMGQVPFLPPNPFMLLNEARKFEASREIDPLDNLKSRRVYVFSGTKDTVVYQQAVNSTVSFFRAAGVPDSGVQYVKNVPAGHALITPSFGNACDANAAPYISHCEVDGQGYDQAGALLTHIYGPLKRKAISATGRFVTFDQRAFAAAATGMADEGYLYVPKSCDAGQACKVHVALHGCVQSAESVGDDFVLDTGYNVWADNNNFLVLYPQVNKSTSPFNPQGCWDWFGYTGANYAKKDGPQMKAIMNMVKALGSGAASGL